MLYLSGRLRPNTYAAVDSHWEQHAPKGVPSMYHGLCVVRCQMVPRNNNSALSVAKLARERVRQTIDSIDVWVTIRQKLTRDKINLTFQY